MWTSSFFSMIGTWMQNVVLPVYVLDRTGDTVLVGLTVFAQLGPQLFLAIPAGVIADRFDRRRWLITMQLVQMVFSAALTPLAAADAPLWAILAVAFGVGCGSSLNAPAWAAMLPTLVARADIPGSVSLSSVSLNASRVVGPVLVAVLRSAGVTIADIFLINAATYLFVVFALARTPLPRPAGRAVESGLAAFTSGIRIVRARADLSRVITTMMLFSLISLPYVGLFAVVARENFGILKDSTRYEWLYATWGTGAALGALAVGTVFVGLDIRALARRALVAFALFLGLFAIVSAQPLAFTVAPLLGFAYFTLATSLNTIYQSRLEDHQRGRAMSLWFMAFGGTVPIGNLLFAPVMDAIGTRWTLGIGAVFALWLARWCDIATIDRRLTPG